MIGAIVGHIREHRWSILRYGVVGGFATFVHLGTALAAEGALHKPFVSNLIGFLVAFGVSFAGHASWTFKLRRARRQAALKFFVVSFAGFMFSTTVLASVQLTRAASPAVALTISVLVIPTFNYLASRFWAFAVDG